MPHIETMPAPFMTPAQVARLLSVTTKTLRDWRNAKPMRGPAYFRTADDEKCSIRYSRESVAAWIEERTSATTTTTPTQSRSKTK